MMMTMMTTTTMGKKKKRKMKVLPSPPSSSSSSSSWQWPSCSNLKTTSFRCSDDTLFRMSNSDEEELIPGAGDPVESVIRGLSSERLFFEPSGQSSSIMEDDSKSKSKSESESTGSLEVVSMDSEDPYADFRTSMEEMVEAHGLRTWAALERLFGCYLRVNAKPNHAYIVGAFIDLLVALSLSHSSLPSSPSSSFTVSHSSLPSSPLSLPSSLSVPTDPGCTSSQPLDPDPDPHPHPGHS